MSFYTGGAVAREPPFEPPSYDEEVRPLLAKRCGHCHGEAGGRLAGLSFETDSELRDGLVGAMADGWSGWKRVEPMRPGESYLMFKLIGDPRIKGMAMPRASDLERGHSLLPDDEIEIVRDWIVSGARIFDPASDEE